MMDFPPQNVWVHNPHPQNGEGVWRFSPERTVCDAKGCEQEAPLVSLGGRKSWLTIDLLPNVSYTHGATRFAHFCSWGCLAAFAHSAEERELGHSAHDHRRLLP